MDVNDITNQAADIAQVAILRGPEGPGIPESAIHRNAIYVAYACPTWNEFHRMIFVTYPSHLHATMYHAVYDKKADVWSQERVFGFDILANKNLKVIYRIGWITWGVLPALWYEEVDTALKSVDMNPKRVRDSDLVDRLKFDDCGGWSDIIWSIDAVQALVDRGLVGLGPGASVEEELMIGRLVAGPEEGRLMLGSPPTPLGLRVVNHRDKELTPVEWQRLIAWQQGDRRVKQLPPQRDTL